MFETKNKKQKTFLLTGYKSIYSNPEWEKTQRKFEQRLGIYAFRHSLANKAADEALAKMKNIVLKHYKEERNEIDVLKQAFTKDDAGSAGQINPEDIEQIFPQEKHDITKDIEIPAANLREKMTALYNASYYTSGMTEESTSRSMTFKNIMRKIVAQNRTDLIEQLGLDKDSVMDQYKKHNTMRIPTSGFMSWASSLIQRKKDVDLYTYSDMALQGNLGQMRDASSGFNSSQVRSKEEHKLMQKSAEDYANIGVGLSDREKRYVYGKLKKQEEGLAASDDERKLLSSIDDESSDYSRVSTVKLPWIEGGSHRKMKPNSLFKRKASSKGMVLTSGLSGTTARMMNTYRWIGLKDYLNFRLALLGWMLPQNDHSLWEIMKASHLVGIYGDEDLTDASTMDSCVSPLAESEIRSNVCERGLLPHEEIYLKNRGINPGQENDKYTYSDDVTPTYDISVKLASSEYDKNEQKELLKPYQYAITKYTSSAYVFMNKMLSTNSLKKNRAMIKHSIFYAINIRFYRYGYDLMKDALASHLPTFGKDTSNPIKTHLEKEIRYLNKELKSCEESYQRSIELLPQFFCTSQYLSKTVGPSLSKNIDYFVKHTPQADAIKFVVSEIESAKDKFISERTGKGQLDKLHDDILEDVNMSMDALEKMPKCTNTIVYRGDITIKQDMSAKSGHEIIFNKLTSTTKDKETAIYFATEVKKKNVSIVKRMLGLKAIPTVYVIELTGKKGCDIHSLSVHPREEEVLCLPGFKIKIAKIEEKDEIRYIYCKET